MSSTLRARPTTYNGVQMRSRLEARIAAALDAIGCPYEYEPNAFASKDGQYLPDFRLPEVALDPVWPREVGELYVEVVATSEKARVRAKRERAILDASTDAPLLYVGWAAASLLGLFYEARSEDSTLGVVARQWIRDEEGRAWESHCLYRAKETGAWMDGFRAALFYEDALRLDR